MISLDFTASSADLENPERGFYVGYDLRSPSRAAQVRSSGHTLALSLVRLDDYRDRSLDAALLDSLEAGFAAARRAGIKVILRFSYNASFSADAPRARILRHLEQLGPLLQRNADVIAVMQAGFIGAWGEWHSSTNGLDNDADRTTILNAILAAVPASRSVQVRTPMFKAAAFPGGPLDEADAFSASLPARVGHHNDCFLASHSDYGTYASPVSTWRAYAESDGRFTPIGGETCAVNTEFTDCGPAIAAMERGHWSYLNRQYNQTVVRGWVTQGCEPEIRQRLGYRLALEHVRHTKSVAPGGEVTLEIDVHNHGFASLYNERPVEVVLGQGASRRVVPLRGVDARRWAPGTTTRLAVRLRIPADVTPGTYTLSLRLPDQAEALADDPRFAIQLANDGIWDDASGDNRLSDQLVIDPSAIGRIDPAATRFTTIH